MCVVNLFPDETVSRYAKYEHTDCKNTLAGIFKGFIIEDNTSNNTYKMYVTRLAMWGPKCGSIASIRSVLKDSSSNGSIKHASAIINPELTPGADANKVLIIAPPLTPTEADLAIVKGIAIEADISATIAVPNKAALLI